MVAAELRLSPFGRRTRSLLVAPARFGRPRDRASGRDLGARARRRVRGRGRGRRSRGPYCELAAAHAEGGEEATAAPMNRRACYRGAVGGAPRPNVAVAPSSFAPSGSGLFTRVPPPTHPTPRPAPHFSRLPPPPPLRPTPAATCRRPAWVHGPPPPPRLPPTSTPRLDAPRLAARAGARRNDARSTHAPVGLCRPRRGAPYRRGRAPHHAARGARSGDG